MYLKKAASIALVLMLVSSITLAQDGPQGDPLSFFLDTFESFASVGQFFAGPLPGNQQAVTSLQVTNRDPNQAECEIGILTHHGVFIPSDFPVLINDVAGPFASAVIPRGRVMRFDLTSSQLVQGAIALGFRTLSPAVCGASSFRVTATSLVTENLEFTSPAGGMSQLRGALGSNRPGDLSEAFSIAANDAGTWLCTGFCLAISTTEGVVTADIRQRLGIAVSSLTPGQTAPPDSQLRLFVYDALGNRFADRAFEVDGSHMTFFPGEKVIEFGGGGTMVFCLESSNPEYKMDLTVIRVNQIQGRRIQFDQAIFTDGFESGDLSAWSTGGS